MTCLPDIQSLLADPGAPAWAQAVLSAAAIVFSGLFAGQAVLRQYRLEQSRRVWTLHGLATEARRAHGDLIGAVRSARGRASITPADARFDRLLEMFKAITPSDFGTSAAIAPVIRAREILVEISSQAANSYLPRSKSARTTLLELAVALRREHKALHALAMDAHRRSRRWWLA